MEKTVTQQFLDLFQEFLNLCQYENWPDDNTSADELKNAFLVAQHIEKCLDKLQNRDLLNGFLTAISENEENANVSFKYCLSDPPKYILRKIINSEAKISQMDIGFHLYVQIFSEKKLESTLADLFVDAASVDALLYHLRDIPRDKIQVFKSHLLLSEFASCDDGKDSVLQLLKSNDQGIIDLLVLCLLNKDLHYHNTVMEIKEAFLNVMMSKSKEHQNFWSLLLNVDGKYLTEMCLEFNDLFLVIVTALVDSSKLLKEQMSAELFYIKLTYSELVFVTQTLCQNECLKTEFLKLASESCVETKFWINML